VLVANTVRHVGSERDARVVMYWESNGGIVCA
jgi:hypothetical protein